MDRAFAGVASDLQPRERAWLQELLYGTSRFRGRLDFYLGAFIRGGLDRLDPIVLDVLRMGAYQLLVMDGVPAYAAVSQSVDQVRAAGAPRAAGLVNGVLQSLRRGWRSVKFPDFEIEPAAYLSTWGSHPRWLVERWLERCSAAETRVLVEANNSRPELFVRPVGMSIEAAREKLGQEGVQAEPVDRFPDSLRILPPVGPVHVLDAAPAMVQDPAAAMVVRYADLADHALVVDLSAAPGGKAIGLADNGPRVVAADSSFDRIQRVRANVDRLGLSERIHPVAADGRSPPFRSAGAILLDVPCTGTGTFRRHPDGRWRLGPNDLTSLVHLQRELITGAVALLEVGGTLVYSTCSLEPEENEEQVEWALGEFPGLRRSKPGTAVDGTMLDGPDLRILPHRHGVDGAYAARMERID